MNQRSDFIFLMQMFEGISYRFAGGHRSLPNPWDGPDCSGMIRWGLILPRIGIMPPQWDATSDDMFHQFAPCEYPYPGCLVFWRDSNRVRHVETVIEHKGEEIILIGARQSKGRVEIWPFDERRFPRGNLEFAGCRDPFWVEKHRYPSKL